MQDIAFATLLFCVYFVSACCFLDKPNQSLINQDLITSNSGEFEPESEVSPVELPSSGLPELGSGVDEPMTIAEAPHAKFEPEPEVEIDTPDTQVQELQPHINARALDVIDKLGKREARRLCSPLGIQQKCNGVELTTELMVASIRREFKTNPERVIEVIGERLPELLSVPRHAAFDTAS
jgi:hypothetical protein